MSTNDNDRIVNGFGHLLGQDETLPEADRQKLIDELELRDNLLLVEKADKKTSSIWTPTASDEGERMEQDTRLVVVKTGPGPFNPYLGKRHLTEFKKGMTFLALGCRFLSAPFLQKQGLYLIDGDTVLVGIKKPRPAVEPVD